MSAALDKFLVPTALGAAQIGASIFNKKKADSIDIPMVDTLQAQALADVYRKSQAINTGADFAAPSKEVDQTQAAASDAIVTAAGGDSSSAISGILKAQRQAGAAKAQIAGQGMQQRAFFTNAFLDMSTRIAQRKLELQLAERSQARLEAAQYLQEGLGNVMLGFANRPSAQIQRSVEAIGKSMFAAQNEIMGKVPVIGGAIKAAGDTMLKESGKITATQPPPVGGSDQIGGAPSSGQDVTGLVSAASKSGLLDSIGDVGEIAGLVKTAGSIAQVASDIRLKENIQKIGVHNGLNVYSFNYIGQSDKKTGVMAQEVLKTNPEAVITMPNGYYAVDYSKINAEWMLKENNYSSRVK